MVAEAPSRVSACPEITASLLGGLRALRKKPVPFPDRRPGTAAHTGLRGAENPTPDGAAELRAEMETLYSCTLPSSGHEPLRLPLATAAATSHRAPEMRLV